MRHPYRTLLVVAALLAASGCAGLGVRPWQRDLLSREEMQPDFEAHDAMIEADIFNCREGTANVRGFLIGSNGCK